ncbi:hypothetical protein CCM_04359 [Cordyceps militaris CM01]|uniref:Uncharacterized protein n=1 Tax=Cordyceps militaris (strain CM01) TaxID=983644 RepID=G3JEH4_CORMM|nr:uncharacterized protein CCM_04359 [Cordyceps militaris CM01]EGX92987.1 hypothetical protein CCM_04359 [Cordyceps militaris CM01]
MLSTRQDDKSPCELSLACCTHQPMPAAAKIQCHVSGRIVHSLGKDAKNACRRDAKEARLPFKYTTLAMEGDSIWLVFI